MDKLNLWMGKLGFRSKLQCESFLYSKNVKSGTKCALSVIACISAAIIMALLVATALGYNPFQLLSDLFTKGTINHSQLIWNVVILGIAGLSFSFAFKAGIFNIGIPGQLLAAGLMVLVITTAIDKAGVKFPVGLGPIFTILIAVFFGALVATIISLLRIYLNVNDVVSSILINWIVFFVARLVIYNYYNPNPNSIFSQSSAIPEQFRLVIPGIGGWVPSLIIFGLLVGIIFFVSKYTVFGHKVMAVGFNPDASGYAGYNVKAVKISTMAISGALAGILAAVLYTAGQTPAIPISKDYNVVPAEGFNGIAIGLIAMNNPIAIIPVAFIIGLFNSSAPFLEVPTSFSQLIMGLIILGATMFVIILNYKPWIWLKKQIYGRVYVEKYQNYINDMDVLISKYYLLLAEEKDKENIAKLKIEFNEQKEKIKNNFAKQLLVLKATQVFFPNIEASNTINTENNKLKQQYLRYENKQNKKVAKAKDNVTKQLNKINKLFNNKLNAKYNLAIIKHYLNQKQILSEKELINFLVFIDLTKNQKFSLFKQLIENGKDLIASDADVQSKVDSLIKTNNEKIDELQAKGIIELLNKKITNKDEFDKLVRHNFLGMSKLEQITLSKMYWKYYSNEAATYNLQTVSKFNELVKNATYSLLSDEELNLIFEKFQIKLKQAVDRVEIAKLKVTTSIDDAYAKNRRSQQQLDDWGTNNIKLFNKFYWWKAKSFGKLDDRYKKFIEQANKINLDEKEKNLLITWIDNSYKEAQELYKKGEQ